MRAAPALLLASLIVAPAGCGRQAHRDRILVATVSGVRAQARRNGAGVARPRTTATTRLPAAWAARTEAGISDSRRQRKTVCAAQPAR
jgi:hypothetical protein